MAVRTYYVWLHNKTNALDDETIKVRAKSEEEAGEKAEKHGYDHYRFYRGHAYTLKELRRA